MIVVYVVLAVLIVGGLTGALVWFVVGRPSALDTQTLAEPTSTTFHQGLPEVVTASTIEGLRFSQAPRGYRMAQVDEVLERLGTEIAARDEEIARLQVELDLARADAALGGSPELGHGPVVRPADEQSLWRPDAGH